jgi:hypothetical protein
MPSYRENLVAIAVRRGVLHMYPISARGCLKDGAK